jgi:pimeloyl-ACP methyl ester carboxylesterase
VSAVERSELTALGLRTPLLQAGPRDATEAVVLLHGQPGSSADWAPLLERVGEFARAVAWDLPGFGKAEKPRDWNYSSGMHATFVAAALAELGIERAHLVMHDLGGTALLWAAAHPDRFASAVIVGTGILVDFEWHPVARLYRLPLVGEAMTRMTTKRGFLTTMRLYDRQPRKLPREFLERLWEDYDLATRRAGLQFYRATSPPAMERLVEPLRRLDRPALVVWGRHDPAVPVVQAERQRLSFPSAEVVVLEESGHWPYVDDPEGFANVALPFLRAQAGGAGARAGSGAAASAT